jgi:hypothetical protein
MRRLFPLVVLMAVLGAVPLSAQQATLDSPVARAAEHNLRVESAYLTRDGGGRWEVVVSVRDSDGNEIRRRSFTGPDDAHPAATVAAFNSALINPRAGEVGADPRKTSFRLLGFLKDQLYAPLDVSTLVP